LTASILELEGVMAGYGGRSVLDVGGLQLGPGLHVVLGPNGSGKTTLFRVCSGVLRPYRGLVRLRGRDLVAEPGVKADLGYCTHRPGLNPSLTVADNLVFWGRLLGLPSETTMERVGELGARLGFDDLLRVKGKALSRGQAQRVALARALLSNPGLILLDEPTTGLDPVGANAFRGLVRTLVEEGRCVLYSSHNLYEATELATDVVLLRSGRIMTTGSVQEVTHRFAHRRRFAIRLGGDGEAAVRVMGGLGSEEGGYWFCELEGDGALSDIIERAVRAGLRVEEVRELGSALEQVYLQLEQEQDRQGDDARRSEG
jgi:ABC-type multidrug transport system ATPase subunit